MRQVNWVFVSAAFAAVLAVAGCAAPASKPGFYQSLDRSGARIDEASARDMVNAYRARNGLPPVTIDAKLMAVAEREAKAMADADRVAHAIDRGNALSDRLAAAGYGFGVAVENVSAGYYTFAEAFSGWRDSPQHNANMLNPNVQRMGIATHYRPGSKYKVFWSMILAAPK
ncbi:MAG: CAP domain-containing protein [Hyphomicrobiales bacterium]|nr:CAP domain-containing protein [Hyphomicrobiales bacterium]